MIFSLITKDTRAHHVIGECRIHADKNTNHNENYSRNMDRIPGAYNNEETLQKVKWKEISCGSVFAFCPTTYCEKAVHFLAETTKCGAC